MNNQDGRAPILADLVSAFNRARPGEAFCPKCGAGIYDPFGLGRVMHDVASCRALLRAGYPLDAAAETPAET